MDKVVYKIFLVSSVLVMLVVDLAYSLSNDGSSQVNIAIYQIETQHTQDEITSNEGRVEDIMNLPLRRELTPVDYTRNRTFHPVRIVLGESPCIHVKSRFFFMEANKRKMSAYDLLMNATVVIQNQDYYFYDAEDLCINVDDELNIDAWQYDCSPDGICVCGIYFGYVDPDLASKIKDNQIQYSEVNGLDRKLVVENGECKSGFRGHCSLPKNNSTLPLICSGKYICVLDDTYGPVIVNNITKQTYGICLPKEMAEELRGDYVYENNAATVLCISLQFFIQIMISQVFHIHEAYLFSN